MMDFIIWFICLSAIAFGLCLAGVSFDQWLNRDNEPCGDDKDEID